MGRRRGEVGRQHGGLGEMEHKLEINPEQERDGGLGEMGFSDEGDRKKNEQEKGRKKRS